MKTQRAIMFAALSALTLCGCNAVVKNEQAKGAPVTKNVAFTSFDEINASAGVVVTYSPAGTREIKVEAPSDLMPYVRVEVKGGTLYCGLKSNPFSNTSGLVKVTAGGAVADELNASSSAVINVIQPLVLPGNEVEIGASSSGAVAVNVTCGSLDMSVSSSGSVNVVGECRKAEAAASSSGAVRAELDVLSEFSAVTSSSGVVDANVRCASCEAVASSSGYISLKGQAAMADFVASSSGLIDADSLMVERGSAAASSSGTVRADFKQVLSNSTSAGGSVILR